MTVSAHRNFSRSLHLRPLDRCQQRQGRSDPSPPCGVVRYSALSVTQVRHPRNRTPRDLIADLTRSPDFNSSAWHIVPATVQTAVR